MDRYRRRDRNEKTNYQLSLEFHGSSFRIRWIRIIFVKNNQRITRLAKPIVAPRNNKYCLSKFKHAESWEMELIESIEEVLYPVRVKKAALMKAHQNILKASKFLNVDIETSTSKQRVQPTSESISKYKSKYV